MSATELHASNTAFLAGGGLMGAMMRSHDWSTSPLGSPEAWPTSLRMSVSLMLGSAFPMFVAWGPDLGFLYNDAYSEILGTKHPHALGRPFQAIWSEIWSDVDPLIQRAMSGEATFEEDKPLRILRKGYMEDTWFTFSYSPVRAEDGRVRGMFCACTETTGRVRAQEDLRRREEELRDKAREFEALAENVSQLAWMAEPDGHIFWYNRRWYDYTGTTLEIMQGWGWRDVHLPDQIQRIIQEVSGRWAAGAAWEGVYYLRSATGEYRPFLTRAEPIRNEAGELVRWFGTNTDISAQYEAEQSLRELNATLEQQVQERTAELRLYRDIIQSNASPICAFDTEFRLIAFNQAHSDEFFRIFGTRVQIGEVFPDLFPADQGHVMCGFMARALQGEVFSVVEEFGDPKLVKPYWEVSYTPLKDAAGRILGAFHYAQDVTARLRAEAELQLTQEALRQSQKLEAIGQLTGGVAHDFNNLLTVIKSSTDLLRRPNLAEERRARYVEAISDAVGRASKVTGQLLAFARRQALKPEVFALCDSVRVISDMVSTLTGTQVRIVTHLPEQQCFVHADPSQFDTALINMAVNARDAMDGEGQITISVQPIERMPAVNGQAAAAGAFVAISLSDTGSGIPPEHIQQIFEPFFTTKRVGQGTGLGLSQVFGFAKQSGGEITVESAVGLGTTFTLYLPQVDDPGRIADRAEAEPLMDGHGTRVLVVEDNAEVGAFAAQTLGELGYRTVLVSNALAALSQLAAGVQRFDVVFTDVIMPGMSGIELAKEIRRRHADLPVVLTSGYSHVLAQEGTGGLELLHKPYSIDQLSRILRKAASGSCRIP